MRRVATVIVLVAPTACRAAAVTQPPSGRETDARDERTTMPDAPPAESVSPPAASSSPAAPQPRPAFCDVEGPVDRVTLTLECSGDFERLIDGGTRRFDTDSLCV
jgi:hypothetical protein